MANPRYNTQVANKRVAMKVGGKVLKPVPADKKKSLGKLPSNVRNKMGFKKDGGIISQAKETIKKIKKNPKEELSFDKTPRSNKVSIGISPLTIARKIIAKRAKKEKDKK
jgi:hypothetical protein